MEFVYTNVVHTIILQIHNHFEYALVQVRCCWGMNGWSIILQRMPNFYNYFKFPIMSLRNHVYIYIYIYKDGNPSTKNTRHVETSVNTQKENQNNSNEIENLMLKGHPHPQIS